jgi:hypothetical protein
MNKKYKIAIVILMGTFAIFAVLIARNWYEGRSVDDYGELVEVNLDNFEDVLSSNEIVRNLPKDAKINLNLYNESMERSYILRRGSVVKGKASDSDIDLTLPVNYLDGLTNRNFCSKIKIANDNGDLGVDTTMSPLRLAVKYNSMYKYRDCLGI